MSEEGDDRPRQKPPGVVAWGLTIASMVLPLLGALLGGLGVSNQGNDVEPYLFFTGFGCLVVAVLLGLYVHLWGMVRGFYPRISLAWISISLLGIVSGVITFAVGVFLMFRLYGAA